MKKTHKSLTRSHPQILVARLFNGTLGAFVFGTRYNHWILVHHVHASGMDNCTLRSEGRTLSMPRALDNVDNLMVQAVESLSYGCELVVPL